MKNIYLTIVFSLFLFCAMAQTEKGNLIVGGTIGLSSTKTKSKDGTVARDLYRTTEANLSPDLGVFIVDNFSLGGKLDVRSSSTRNLNNDNKYSTTTFTIGPWLRYYFPVGTNAAVFGDLDGGFGVHGTKRKEIDGQGRVRTITDPGTNIFRFGIGPGFSYFLNEHVGLEATLFYNTYRTAYKGNDDIKHISSLSGIYFNVGLQVYL